MSKRVNLNAITLDGTNDYVLVSDQDAFSFTDDTSDKPFSISAWVFVGDVASDNGPIAAKVNFNAVGGATVKSEWLFKQENGEVCLFLYDNNGSLSGDSIRARSNIAAVTDNTWHHIAATYDGSGIAAGMKVYADGALLVSTNDATNSGAGHGLGYVCMRNSTIAVALGATLDGAAGAGGGNRVFEDKLADICLFNKELSASEISEVYNSGQVKDMTRFSAYGSIVSWWKMGDDQDNTATGGIKDYVSEFNGSVQNGATISAVPALPTDRIYNNNVMIPSSWGRTRQPKNVAGDHQVYIHGGIAGNMPTADPSGAAAGYATENQRYLHLYWKAASTTAAVTTLGYSYASGQWSELYDTNGTQVKLSVSAAAANIMRVFEVSGVDRVYFKQSGTALAATDLFAAAASSF